ncbi:MAG: coat protein [Sanya fiers-like virus 4]|nr:MAG: coat protein [Sanya fiers-like virus 4]UUW21180.1 MAG: coat protein [Sanya fiers-like virus 4]UUW21184.1 MAG: coat protein [Sanya fiers-like virus 4]UUW21188.1 MAG: coat protein [Sanya fiers-like virus 4]
MAARTNLVLKDRAATPVNHTFTPDGTDANGVHIFSEKVGVPAGYPRFTARLNRTSEKFRATLKLAVPITQTQVINGVSAPVIVRTSYAEVNFTFDALSTDQERKDAVGMIADSLLATQTQINDMIVNLSDIY